MSIAVLGICVICYFIANIYQNKFSSSLKGQIYPMNYFQIVWMGVAGIGYFLVGLFSGGMHFSGLTIWLGSLAGIMSILGGMALMGGMARGPLSMTILIYSMYIVIPPIMAGLFLHETVTKSQIIAILLIIVVIFLSNSGGGKEKKIQDRWWWFLCIGSVICIGLSNFVMKFHQKIMPGAEIKEYSIVSYIWGILIAGLFAVVLRNREMKLGHERYRITAKYFVIPAIMTALVQGCANVCNLYNASRLPAIVLYPVTQLSTLMLTVLYGILFLKEHPTKRTVSCLLLGVAAIVLMNF